VAVCFHRVAACRSPTVGSRRRSILLNSGNCATVPCSALGHKRTNVLAAGRLMKRVVLISCVSKKLPHAALAKDLYVSALFQFCLGYARTLEPDNIFILSAKYGLVDCLSPTTIRSIPSGTQRSGSGRKLYCSSCVQNRFRARYRNFSRWREISPAFDRSN
jgi:hypothetical protein